MVMVMGMVMMMTMTTMMMTTTTMMTMMVPRHDGGSVNDIFFHWKLFIANVMTSLTKAKVMIWCILMQRNPGHEKLSEWSKERIQE